MSYGIKVKEHVVCGETVRIKTLSGGEHSSRAIELMQKMASDPSLLPELGGVLMAACLVDDAGDAVFSSADDARKAASLGFIKSFVEVSLEDAGLGEDAEEVLKNS